MANRFGSQQKGLARAYVRVEILRRGSVFVIAHSIALNPRCLQIGLCCHLAEFSRVLPDSKLLFKKGGLFPENLDRLVRKCHFEL